jgi:hypothetical protein
MKKMEYSGTNGGLNSNPEGLYVYRKRQHPGNTTPAGVEQPMFIVHFYKHSMPPASLLPLTLVNGIETATLTTGLQPNSMWLKPVTLMNSANRQLPACRTGRKQTAIKQTACPDYSGAIKQTKTKQTTINDFTTGLNMLYRTITHYSLLTTHY